MAGSISSDLVSKVAQVSGPVCWQAFYVLTVGPGRPGRIIIFQFRLAGRAANLDAVRRLFSTRAGPGRCTAQYDFIHQLISRIGNLLIEILTDAASFDLRLDPASRAEMFHSN